MEEDLDARVERLRAKVERDRRALEDAKRRRREVAAHHDRVQRWVEDLVDRMQRPTAG